MRIGIYDPYLDTLGGGEKYILSIASYLSKENQVDLFWNDKSIIKKAEAKLNVELKSIFVRDNIFLTGVDLLKKIKECHKYDLIIYISDGSIPILFAKKNILIFQFPVNWVSKKNIFTKLKLKKINKIICYTEFVKKYLDQTFKKDVYVLYPPVDQMTVHDSKKENIILTVGRFTKAMNEKKQEILIEAFKDMVNNGLKNWKLIVAGSYLPQDEDFFNSLKMTSVGYPIEIAANVSYSTLSNFYKRSKIYWHAAGFGEDLEKHPERAEHFGITTVEAMGAGAVPVVINAGGQREIATNKKDGYLWSTISELKDKTMMLIDDDSLRLKIAKNARLKAKEFSKEKFHENLDKLIK